MLNPAYSNMIDANHSAYSLVVAVAKRAREIAMEAEENGEILSKKPVQIAVEEFSEGKFQYEEPENGEEIQF